MLAKKKKAADPRPPVEMMVTLKPASKLAVSSSDECFPLEAAPAGLKRKLPHKSFSYSIFPTGLDAKG